MRTELQSLLAETLEVQLAWPEHIRRRLAGTAVEGSPQPVAARG